MNLKLECKDLGLTPVCKTDKDLRNHITRFEARHPPCLKPSPRANNGLDVPIEPWRARSEPAATVLNVWQVSG